MDRNRKIIIAIIVVAILLLGIVVTVYLVQRPQTFTPQASQDQGTQVFTLPAPPIEQVPSSNSATVNNP